MICRLLCAILFKLPRSFQGVTGLVFFLRIARDHFICIQSDCPWIILSRNVTLFIVDWITPAENDGDIVDQELPTTSGVSPFIIYFSLFFSILSIQSLNTLGFIRSLSFSPKKLFVDGPNPLDELIYSTFFNPSLMEAYIRLHK